MTGALDVLHRLEKAPHRDEPCSFCGRSDVKVANGPVVSICLFCAECAVEALTNSSRAALAAIEGE